MSRTRQKRTAGVLRGRDTFPELDALWTRLSRPARETFLRAAVAHTVQRPRDAADVLELVEQGFALLCGGAVSVHGRCVRFADRLKLLQQWPLLYSGKHEHFAPHVSLVLRLEPDRYPHFVHLAIANMTAGAGRSPGSAATLLDCARSVEWLRRMPPLLEHQAGVRAALGCLARNLGLVSLAELSREVGADTYPALDTLLSHFVAFEGLDPTTHELMVGLLPSLRAPVAGTDPDCEAGAVPVPASVPPSGSASASASSAYRTARVAAQAISTTPATPAPPDPVPPPATLDVTGAPLVLEDMETWLVYLASERVRVTVTGAFYAEDDAPARASVAAAGEHRVATAEARYGLVRLLCRELGLEQLESVKRGSGSTSLLRPGAAASEFLALSVEQRMRRVIDLLIDERRRPWFAGQHGAWLGGTLDNLAARLGPSPPTREHAARVLAPFATLQADAFHDLKALLDAWRGRSGPVFGLFLERLRREGRGAGDAPDLLGRQLRYALDAADCQGREPLEALDRAYARGVRDLLVRLSLLGGVQMADVLGERATIRLTEVGRYYLGLTKTFPARLEIAGDGTGAAAGGVPRVVVQPNLEVLVIGRAAAVELALARFAARQPGAGPARTYTLSRERVIVAVANGLAPDGIEQVFSEAVGGVDVPPNVSRTLLDWARAVRRARLVHVPVLVCDDEETALTIRSLATQGTVIPGDVVPVEPSKLAAFKKALQKKGIVLDEDDEPHRGRERRAW